MNTQRTITLIPAHLKPTLDVIRQNEGLTSTEIWGKLAIAVKPSILPNQLKQLTDSGHITRRWMGNAYVYFAKR